ncbi:MAG: hydrogenase maturation nickel metallochaperone HypA [Leptonema illini]|uniref:Hydrogenase maturation nickel metallochaperone HypA n=1 Tax=Leptonema illini TaxID=183 RepID=A0A833GZU2_9LEPT|nr:MAG: hydrogenase maturation nickel metallochaperone HypA [Leptonema illini]
MHELSIAESIIEIVRDEIASREEAVLAVHLRAGRLANIFEESVVFYYDCLKAEIPQLSRSRLLVDAFAEQARCRSCLHEFAIDSPVFFCPQCGAVADLLDTESLQVESIELADPDTIDENGVRESLSCETESFPDAADS